MSYKVERLAEKPVAVDLHTIGCRSGVSECANKLRSRPGAYDLVLEVSPISLLENMGEMPPEFCAYAKTCVATEYPDSCPWQWADVIVPFMNAAIGCILKRNQNKTSVAIVAASPYRPALGAIITDDMVAECCAYAEIGVRGRGGECGRTAIRIVPEGFSHLVARASSEGWIALAIPANSTKCAMVLKENRAWLFKRSSGKLLHVCEIVAGKANHHPFVFECALHGKNVIVYDCAMSDGTSVRQSPLPDRLELARSAIGRFALGDGFSASVADATRVGNSGMTVLFAKPSSPCLVGPMGDFFEWKEPSLLPDQYVLACRSGECMAIGERDECILCTVGNIAAGEAKRHMGSYVCEKMIAATATKKKKKKKSHVDDDDGFEWKVIRPAKSCERLFTVAEVFAEPGKCSIMVSREAMSRLLPQSESRKRT